MNREVRRRVWSLAALVVLLMTLVIGLVWWQTARSHDLMRQQVMAQAEQRSLQLADAMAGQVAGLLTGIDLALQQMRREWDGNAGRFDATVRSVLSALPPGVVTHVSVADVDGQIVYNSLGIRQATYVGDRDHFKVHTSGGDRLVVGKPVFSRLVNAWAFIVNRPILRDGRFAGTMNISVSSEYLARNLARLQLSGQDVISLLHGDGSFMARSQDFLLAMGKGVPQDRPFLAPGAPAQGVFHMPGAVDQTARIFAWHRMNEYGLISVIGLAEETVLAPLVAGMERDRQISVGLVGVVALFGGYIVLLLARATRKQEAIAESEAFRKRVFENSPVPIVVMDHETLQYIDCNPAATAIYRFASRAQTLGRTPLDVSAPLQYDGSPSAEKAGRYVDKAIRDGSVVFDWRHRRPDGELWDAEVHLLSFLAADRLLFQFTLHDITERKRAEDALRRLNEELETRVAQRTAEMAAARDEAERANEAKSEFLSRMSHELRTPLNAILGFGQLLSLDVREKEQAESVQEVLHAGQHLLDLINEVLDLARIESGKFAVSLEPVPLAALVADCLALIRPQAHARGIRIAEAGLEWRGNVLGDRTRLKQVLLNLLSNAVKYNREGGSIDIHCVIEGNAILIRIGDSGAGLSAEQQARLFVPFERLDADGTAIEGTGIGLALSKRLVELMEGEIGVDSTPGEGSTFWVRLPVADGQAPGTDSDAPQAGEPAGGAGGARRWEVLCIEDNPANLRLMGRILARRQDIRLLTATAPGQGLELARSHRPALILLDINLPDMDGYEVMQCLRENPATRAIPVVAISANAMPKDLERGQTAGFVDYLTKPLDVDKFTQVVSAILDQCNSSGANRHG